MSEILSINLHNSKVVAVILAGGSGSRLWPLSREYYPKQLITLIGEHSLLQATALRVTKLSSVEKLIVVCNEQYRFLIAEQLREINIHATLILEPEGKDTAAAIALAAVHIMHHHSETLMLVLPADHLIEDEKQFSLSVENAILYALQNKIVTFGVTPTSAHVGYGYIQAGNSLAHHAFEIAQFVEKPIRDVAENYLHQGGYFWNSGIFLFSASQYLNELTLFEPLIANKSSAAMQAAVCDTDFIRPNPKLFAEIPKKSIDYALMEHTQHGVIIPFSASWVDLGSWLAVAEQEIPDAQGNVLIGDVYIENVQNSYLRSESRVLAVVGMQEIIAVETGDAVLIANKSSSESIKIILEKLKLDQRIEAKSHLVVHQPWGSFQCLIEGKGYQIRQVIIRPGMALTQQQHTKHSKHWVVLEGEAHVLKDQNLIILKQHQSTFIPTTMLHMLKNLGTMPLVLVEVRVGDDLNEEDSERE